MTPRLVAALLVLAAAVQADLSAEVRRAFKRKEPTERAERLRMTRPLISPADRRERNRAAASIEKALKKEASPRVRIAAVDFLYALRTDRALDRVIVAYVDKSEEVRGHVGRLAEARMDQPLHEAIVRALTDDASWRFRAAMVELLLSAARESAKRPLVDALKDEHPAVRARAAEALERLTHKAFGENQAKWREYFASLPRKKPKKPLKPRKNTGETVSVADAHKRVQKLKTGPILGLTPKLYTIPIREKRVVFVVDMSNSMAKGSRTSHFVELKRAIFGLATDVQLNVLCFDQRMFFFTKAKSLVPATTRNKARVERWLNDLPAGEKTDVNRSIASGLAMLREALLADSRMRAELFILTDGRETAKTTPLRVVEMQYQKLPEDRCRVHVVALGKKGTETLRRLTERSSGSYVEAP